MPVIGSFYRQSVLRLHHALCRRFCCSSLAAEQLANDVMSSVTHELSTPLTSIRAMAEMMLDETDMASAQRQQFLQIIVAESGRLTRLVNQVLDIAKIESGQAEWHKADIDMVALLQQCVLSMQASYHDAKVHLSLQSDAEVVPLRADADRLTQVVLNLLANALKFAPRETGVVEVYLRDVSNGVQVEVTDNGSGLALKDQEKIFAKFQQVGGEQPPQGTGLGLPISLSIIEHFGGRMWVKSVPGEGACFGFYLPRKTTI